VIPWKLNIEKVAHPVFIIYSNPLDFPGKFVVRLFDADQPTDQHFVVDTLEQAQNAIPFGMTRFRRMAQDERQIVETWL
jgi:hypothetical protein